MLCRLDNPARLPYYEGDGIRTHMAFTSDSESDPCYQFGYTPVFEGEIMLERTLYTDDDFRQAVVESTTATQVFRRFGLKPNGSTYRWFWSHVKELSADTSHFLGAGHNKGKPALGKPFVAQPLEDILIEDSAYTNRRSLKKRLLLEKLLEYRCATCGLVSWNEQELVLILDHINGVGNDHRIENLRLLCPNCNSQTPTFAGRNIRH